MTEAEYAKRLIGRPCRLRLARWLLAKTPDAWVTQNDAVVELGGAVGQSEVRQGFLFFEELRMVRLETRTERGQPRPYYRRLDTSLWDVYAAADRAIRERLGEDDRERSSA